MSPEELACRLVAAESGGPAGVVSLDRLWERMDEGQRQKALSLLPGQRTLVCTVFPYYDGAAPGNLSLYARGQDYHLVARQRLGEACARLERAFPGFRFQGYADTSPYPEVYACACAGLGVVGLNGLLLTPCWGSYVFCGVVVTDLPLEGGKEPAGCIGCGRCQDACPGGALHSGRLEEERCLSALTQRRGKLEPWQQELVIQGGLAWGCDRCQSVCPYNRAPEHTQLEPFRQRKRSSITLIELEGMGDRAFRRQFADRAFAWRGIAPLRRNLQLLDRRETGEAE